jgi:pimeloyl-ACP methyl ester carboxylesterase
MISYPCSVGPTITRVLEAGAPDAPAIVLVHGLSSRADRFVRNIDTLAASGYRVVAADLPGHGFATKDPQYDHTIPGYADFVLGLLDKLGIARATIVGTSLGGHVVASAVLKQPQRAERFMMIGSTGFAPSVPERVQGMRDWLRNLTPESHRPKLQNVFCDKSLATDDMVREDVKINTSPGAWACFDKFLTYMADGFNRDLVLEPLAAIDGRIPLLLFWGVEDSSVPVERGRAARERLTKARLVCVENLNHTPYYENPPLFNDVLLRFIEGKLDGIRHPGLTLT